MALSGLPLWNVTVSPHLRVGGRHTPYTSELESWTSCYASIVLAGDHDVPRTNSSSSSRRTSATTLARFDLREFSDPPFARSLVPDVRRPSSRQLARAVFAHPLLVAALARFADSKFVARDDLLAFFVAAGATSRAAAQSSASTYASLRALLVWLVPELTLSVPIVADVPSSVRAAPTFRSSTNLAFATVPVLRPVAAPLADVSSVRNASPSWRLILRERQMRRALDLPCGAQPGLPHLCYAPFGQQPHRVFAREVPHGACAYSRARSKPCRCASRFAPSVDAPHVARLWAIRCPGTPASRTSAALRSLLYGRHLLLRSLRQRMFRLPSMIFRLPPCSLRQRMFHLPSMIFRLPHRSLRQRMFHLPSMIFRLPHRSLCQRIFRLPSMIFRLAHCNARVTSSRCCSTIPGSRLCSPVSALAHQSPVLSCSRSSSPPALRVRPRNPLLRGTQSSASFSLRPSPARSTVFRRITDGDPGLDASCPCRRGPD